jgi:tetrahydromethanopterin S-methyltransferase subunit E
VDKIKLPTRPMYFIHLEFSLSLVLFIPWIKPIIDNAKDIKMGIRIIINTKIWVTVEIVVKRNINKNISRKSSTNAITKFRNAFLAKV